MPTPVYQSFGHLTLSSTLLMSSFLIRYPSWWCFKFSGFKYLPRHLNWSHLVTYAHSIVLQISPLETFKCTDDEWQAADMDRNEGREVGAANLCRGPSVRAEHERIWSYAAAVKCIMSFGCPNKRGQFKAFGVENFCPWKWRESLPQLVACSWLWIPKIARYPNKMSYLVSVVDYFSSFCFTKCCQPYDLQYHV